MVMTHGYTATEGKHADTTTSVIHHYKNMYYYISEVSDTGLTRKYRYPMCIYFNPTQFGNLPAAGCNYN